MAKPNIFISHRWKDQELYYNLINKFDQYGFAHLDYSVPQHDPLNVNTKRRITAALSEQVKQCNYFIIISKLTTNRSEWCELELQEAQRYDKPILGVRPFAYTGNDPVKIQTANTEGIVGFNIPPIIRKICAKLNHPIPQGL
ncbi:MAG: TIR domain-containing protein [Methylobacter sp.]